VIDFAAREIATFLEGFWETSGWLWVNRPSCVHAAENKLTQLQVAQRLGFFIPRTLVTNDAFAAREFVRAVPEAIAKPIGGSRAEIDGLGWCLFTHPVKEGDLSETAMQIAPCIFQERLPRKSDVRVTVVGRQVFAAEIFVRAAGSEVDWRAVNPQDLRYEPHKLPDALEELCRSMLERLDLRYGCFDFIRTPDDRYVFLEVNPSGQWGWIEHEVGAPITRALGQLLIEVET
jgi:glutathione synthase/RimK-type ligase-like ATP-grasp enzyme